MSSTNQTEGSSEGFEEELQALLNKWSLEGYSNTPDFLLAKFITNCVSAFNEVTRARDRWYGIELVPGQNVKFVDEEKEISPRTDVMGNGGCGR